MCAQQVKKTLLSTANLLVQSIDSLRINGDSRGPVLLFFRKKAF